MVVGKNLAFTLTPVLAAGEPCSHCTFNLAFAPEADISFPFKSLSIFKRLGLIVSILMFLLKLAAPADTCTFQEPVGASAEVFKRNT